MALTNIIKKNNFDVPGLSFDERTCLLHSSLMNSLANDLQDKLIKSGTKKTLRKGEFLFMAGDSVNSVHCLLTGKLNEYYSNEAGEVCLRRILLPGSYISLHMIFKRLPCYSYSCETINPSTFFTWETSVFLKLLKEESSLGFQVSSVLSEIFENSCRLNCICRKKQAVSRVAGYLLRRCSSLSPGPQIQIGDIQPGMLADIRPIGITANDICLARETFSRALTSLQERDIIRVKNGIVEIIDIDALKKVSGTV